MSRPTGWMHVSLGVSFAALVTLGLAAQGPASGVTRARLVLPTIQTLARPPVLAVAAIKRDGTVWERFLEDDPLVFGPAREVPQARGARAFGTDLVVRTDGGFVTRQPFAGVAPDDGWVVATRADLPAAWREPPLDGQPAVRLLFPDRYLFSDGTLVQKDAPFGARIEGGRLAGFFAARDVVQFGLGRSFLAALLSDGSLVSTPRASGGTPVCVGRPVVSTTVSDRHGAAVLADGRVAMWGDLSLGQLGAAGRAASPLTPVRGLANITQAAISDLLVLAVAVDRAGAVWTWGALGRSDYVVPRRVRGLDGVVHVDYSIVGLALKRDGTAWAFNPGLIDSVPVKVFDDVKLPERLELTSHPDSPCARGSERSRSPLLIQVPPDDPGRPSGGSVPEPALLPRAPAAPSAPSAPRAAPAAPSSPFGIVGRYACQDASGTSQGTAVVTTRSRLSCADARREHERLKAAKGGDFCAEAISGSHTVGVTFVPIGPCRERP